MMLEILKYVRNLTIAFYKPWCVGFRLTKGFSAKFLLCMNMGLIVSIWK